MQLGLTTKAGNFVMKISSAKSLVSTDVWGRLSYLLVSHNLLIVKKCEFCLEFKALNLGKIKVPSSKKFADSVEYSVGQYLEDGMRDL